MRILKFIYYKWNERKRMYIIDEFNDYEKFIEEQQKAASKIKDKTFKISAILNLYNGYYFTNQLEKAEKVIKSLDIESMDNSTKCAYYYYLINHYIATSNKIMLDKFWEESQSSLEELRQNDAQLYRKLKINYNNFKGLYEESNKILLKADYDEKGDIFYDLLKTETYFNIGKENEAKLIINGLPKDNKKLPPIFKKKIKELQVRYMNVENEGFINKDKTNEKISFKDKVWLKFRDLDFMRNLLLLFIYVKNILKNKHVLVVFGIIIATYLWEFIGIIGLRNNIYWNYWTHFMLDIFNKVFMINIMILLLKYMIKSKKYLKTMLVTLIMLSSMGFIFYVQPYSSTLMAIIKDLPYVVSKSYVEEVTTIEYINMVDEIDYQYMEIETSNKINFELFNNNNIYNYIMENCYEGDVVKIKYLPNTKDIIYLELEDITK